MRVSHFLTVRSEASVKVELQPEVFGFMSVPVCTWVCGWTFGLLHVTCHHHDGSQCSDCQRFRDPAPGTPLCVSQISLSPEHFLACARRGLGLPCGLAVLLSLCVVFETSSHISSWPATHYAVKDNLKFLIPLPLPTKCWHGRHELSCCTKPGLYLLFLPTKFSHPGEDCPDSKISSIC